jgi:hypothetical protein
LPNEEPCLNLAPVIGFAVVVAAEMLIDLLAKAGATAV